MHAPKIPKRKQYMQTTHSNSPANCAMVDLVGYNLEGMFMSSEEIATGYLTCFTISYLSALKPGGNFNLK